ncbi:tRNA (guanine-N(1)-)-methyltransferase [Lactobacillus amylovorus]|uniref:tRNA (Guanine-N(1)-)-methyltransferase n=1 Tax=Lactobacillus amylovorus TaxID=1604 RepID=F0TFR0_LACAM|nr:tRNA (guanine-N(1)-)-methyltransferase [Lactobacillus amylovorus]
MIINLSAEATYLHRPDMLEKRELSDEEKKMLADIKAEAKSTTLD